MDIFSAYIRGLSKICGLYAMASVYFVFPCSESIMRSFWVCWRDCSTPCRWSANLITAASAATIAYLMPTHRAMLFWNVPANSVGYARSDGVLLYSSWPTSSLTRSSIRAWWADRSASTQS